MFFNSDARDSPRNCKKADPRAHLKESHWEARAGAEPQHCKHAICSFGI